MPYFSVIIPTYNRYRLTKRAINSVLQQTYADFELIIVNDGSNDCSYKLENDYKGKITYIETANFGVSAARNIGIKNAQGKHIAFLDSDDEWQPEKLSRHKEYIEDNPGIRIHQCNEIWIRNNKRVNPMNKHLKREGDIFADSLQLCLISPSSVVMKMSLFNTYGSFDENLPACEDYDLWLRITAFEQVGLLNEQLNTRYGGHNDQLSARFWGMDRFRVYAILKLLAHQGASLKTDHKKAAFTVVNEKIKILYNGALKRDNYKLQTTLNTIQQQIAQGTCSSIDYLSLLKA